MKRNTRSLASSFSICSAGFMASFVGWAECWPRFGRVSAELQGVDVFAHVVARVLGRPVGVVPRVSCQKKRSSPLRLGSGCRRWPGRRHAASQCGSASSIRSWIRRAENKRCSGAGSAGISLKKLPDKRFGTGCHRRLEIRHGLAGLGAKKHGARRCDKCAETVPAPMLQDLFAPCALGAETRHQKPSVRHGRAPLFDFVCGQRGRDHRADCGPHRHPGLARRPIPRRGTRRRFAPAKDLRPSLEVRTNTNMPLPAAVYGR